MTEPPHPADAPAQIAAGQADVARALVASCRNVREVEWGDREWRLIVVDHETLLDDADPRTSTIAVVIAASTAADDASPAAGPADDGPAADDGLAALDFRLSAEAKAALAALNDTMATMHPDGRWTTAVVRISDDGRFRFEFDYGPPYRLSGHPHDTRYDDVLARFRAGGDDGGPGGAAHPLG